MLKRKKEYQTRNMVAAVQNGKIASEELKKLFAETVNFCNQQETGWEGDGKALTERSFSQLYLEV